MRARAWVMAVAAVGAMVAGCGGGGGASAAGDKLTVQASFYPLQWLTEQVGGDAVTVSNLTKPGAEPHDLELTPQDVAEIARAGLVVYLSGLQPAVDEAVRDQAADRAFDAAKSANLDLTFTPIEEGRAATDEAGSVDPHFWLDPKRLADVGDALAARLGQAMPGRAAAFTERARSVRATLEALDADYRGKLAHCANKDLVTSHNAFGYLAQAYGLKQVGITGLTPEEEPSPTDLAAVTQFVRTNGVKTIYYETLVSPSIADTVARETGAGTAVLDPIEGLNDHSQGHDYLDVMRSNLANIVNGQPCS
jgi:zinc transport system substrate-binding protein